MARIRGSTVLIGCASECYGDVWGSYPWSGTSVLQHMALATLTLGTGIATICPSTICPCFKYRVKREDKMLMPRARKKIHRLIGASFIILWLVTLVVGINIFIESYLS